VLPEELVGDNAACYVTCTTGSDIGRGIHRRMLVSDDGFLDAPTLPRMALGLRRIVASFVSFAVLSRCVDELEMKAHRY